VVLLVGRAPLSAWQAQAPGRRSEGICKVADIPSDRWAAGKRPGPSDSVGVPLSATVKSRIFSQPIRNLKVADIPSDPAPSRRPGPGDARPTRSAAAGARRQAASCLQVAGPGGKASASPTLERVRYAPRASGLQAACGHMLGVTRVVSESDSA
jgi:hypothetical protein